MSIRVGKLEDIQQDIAFIEKTRKIPSVIEMQQRPKIQELQESNIVKEVLTNLDKDELEPTTNLTSIDFNTRLNNVEIGSLVALQMLHTLGVGGAPCSLISRSIKRHKVSLRGLGREEKVRIVQGEREHETQNSDTSLFGKLKGFMGGNNEQK